jgi:hypothetical protein
MTTKQLKQPLSDPAALRAAAEIAAKEMIAVVMTSDVLRG